MSESERPNPRRPIPPTQVGRDTDVPAGDRDEEPEVVPHAEPESEDMPWCISCAT